MCRQTVNHATHSHHILDSEQCAECRKQNQKISSKEAKKLAANSKVFDFPIKTFDPKNLLKEMVKAQHGEVFVLESKQTKMPDGEYYTEMVIAQVRKVTSY